MFKKSLLALALASTAFSGVVSAATTLADVNEVVSIQGSTNALFVTLADQVYTAGATTDTIVGGSVVITVTGGALVDDSALAPTLTDTNGGAGTTIYTYDDTNSTSTSLIFTVSVAASDAADVITLSNVRFTTASVLAASSITTSYTSFNAGGAVIVGATAIQDANKTRATISNEFNLITDAAAGAVAPFAGATTNEKLLDGIIDVNEARTEFTAATADSSVTQDLLVFSFEDITTDINNVDPSELTVTMSGDFSYLDADGDDAIDTGAVVAGLFEAVALSSDKMTLTLTDTDPANGQTDYSIELDADAEGDSVLIGTNTYTYSVTAEYADALAAESDVVVTTGNSAGEWVLNGSSDDIAFLPFGSDYAQSITVTNSGATSGAITVDLIANGMTYSKVLVGEAAAKTVNNISKEVADFAAASGITGNANIVIVVNAPSGDIAVKGLYYHKPTQDRVLTH